MRDTNGQFGFAKRNLNSNVRNPFNRKYGNVTTVFGTLLFCGSMEVQDSMRMNLKETASEPHIFNSMAVATKTTTVQPQNSTAMMTHYNDQDSDPNKH